MQTQIQTSAANIVPFQFENFTVRVVEIDGKPWFIAKDVADAFGYDQTANGLKHCKQATVLGGFNKSNNLHPATKWVPESDVYELVLRSRNPLASKARDALLAQVSDSKVILRALNSFEVPDDIPDMYVYAIRETDTGNVKLGISRDPLQRLRTLQTGNSSKLALVAYRKAENRFADERALHADAAAYRLRGEWFAAGAMEVM